MNADLHAAVELRLRAIGQRYTTKRRALVDALVKASNPVAVPDLARRRSLPQSSLYRNLAVLEQAGAVHRVMTHEEFGRYELAEDLTQHHHHLVCRSCGDVAEVSSELFHGLAQTLEREKSFLVDMGHIALFGLCGLCGGTP